MKYEMGVVYVWQNQIGEMAHLNGTECTVTSAPAVYWCVIARAYIRGQKVDTPLSKPGYWYFASPGDLRRKQPPTGIVTVLAWFTAPAPREVEAA